MARAGRTGRALSLLTRDELPYLLDLHLFLSRPLQPAPVVPLAEARKAADCLDVASSLYGSFPQVLLEGVTAMAWRIDAPSQGQSVYAGLRLSHACLLPLMPHGLPASLGHDSASWNAHEIK